MSSEPPETELLAVPTSEGAEWMPVQVRRSRRARRLRITIGSQGEVVLTLPRGCSRKMGIEFLNRHGDWMKKHLGQRSHRKEVSLLAHVQKQGWLAVGGVRRPVEVGFGERSAVVQKAGTVQLVLNRELEQEAELLRLLRKLAAQVLKERVLRFAQEKGLAVGRVSVRDQKSRWGSCSDRGTVSLNWRLVLVRPELQDYILLHELAHMTEMNHSEKFWELLEAYDSKARVHDREVTRISRDVMALGR